MIGCKEIQEYIDIARSGEYSTGKDTLAFCDLVEKAFKTEDIHVDTDQLARYMRQQKYFPFDLFPWEKCIFALTNCTYTRSGALRWPNLFCMVGRGSGKNGYLSFNSFCLLLPVNGVDNYDISLYATSEKQAKTSFMDVWNVLERNKKKMKKYFKWTLEEITNIRTQSKFCFRTSAPESKDGGREGCVAFDELHQYKNYDLISVAEGGLGKKPHPREVIITTDGKVRGGPLDDYKERAMDVLYHDQPDQGWLYFICRLDAVDEVDDPALWHKANPSLRYFPDLYQIMQKQYSEYKANPQGSEFLTKRMNLPQTYEAQSVADWDDIKACRVEKLPDLEYTDCVAGIDYAKTNDWVAAGLLFRNNDIYYWLPHFWVCRASADLPYIKAPVDQWAQDGAITFIDDQEIDPNTVAAWLEEKAQHYNITRVGLDNFRYTWLSRALQEHGIDTSKGGAIPLMLTKRITINRHAPLIISNLKKHRFAWDDPTMCWQTYNTATEIDRSGNQTFIKKDAKTRKNDGFMALVAAFAAAEDLADSGSSQTYIDDFNFWNA